MIPETSTNPKSSVVCIPPVRTVALCDIDPAKFAVPPQGMPAGPGANVLMAFDAADGIHAALRGDVDMLIIDGRQVSVGGLTALSFLQQECPELPVYFFVESEGRISRVQPWSQLA